MTEDYPIHSRVHRLRIGDAFGVPCYIKREDELGCLLSGSKVRKYRTQVRALKERGCQKCALIGSENSNHVLGLSSLLIENQIEPTLFLLQAKEQRLIGNSLFTRLFVPAKNIHYIERKSWHLVEEMAQKWQEKTCEFGSVVIPEGGSLSESVPGLATLAYDIVRNEEECGITFGNILIDAGTGLTAASLIAAFGLLQKEAHIHVMLAASTPTAFSYMVERATEALEVSISSLPPFTTHSPPTAKSFGSTNAHVFQQIAKVAQDEGVLLDPIYSAKLYLLLKKLLQEQVLQGPSLFIHSGGVFSLSGFQTALLRTLH